MSDALMWIAVGIWVGRVVPTIASEVIISAQDSLRRRRRTRDFDKFVAARSSARKECEERMRAEDRWDNYELQDAMDEAGECAVPGFRP